MGVPPLALVQEKNLAAAEILIGQVEELAPAPEACQPQPPGSSGQARLFYLRVFHVVKAERRTQVGDRVAVHYVQEDQGDAPTLAWQRFGAVPPVRVAPGDLVIVYANPREHASCTLLVPVWGGLSVVRLTPPPPPGAATHQ